jgi:hypothetical protein
MDHTPPTNELIERLEARLSPAGNKALEELKVLETKFANTEGAESMPPDRVPGMDEALEVLGPLSDKDRALVSQILQLRARAHEEQGKEYMEDVRQGKLAVAIIVRAQELERAAGREPGAHMTLGDALVVLENHGESVPEHLDTERVMDVPQETERIVSAFYPDFTNADTWRRWDGSEQARAWAKLQDFREECIAASIGELAGMDFAPIDYAGLVAALWGIDEDEAKRIVLERRGY